MWYKTPGEYFDLLIEIKSDEQVKGMVQLASKRGSIHLYVEGGVDSEWEGEYDDEMMNMLREEWTMRTDEYSDEDEAEWDVSGPDENSDTASMGEGETDGTFSIYDSESKLGDAECLEATRNRRQMREGRILHYGSVNGGKTASVENRKEYKDEIGEPANRNDVVRSSCQGIEHDEISSKATTEVEDQRDFSSVKRDRTVKNDRVIAKTSGGSGTRCASSPGRDLAERGKARGMTSTSRKSKASRPGGDTASSLRKGVASNSGRGIPSSSQSSVTWSSGRGGGSSSKKGATSSSGRVMALSLQRVRGSCSRRGTTEKGASPSSGRGIAPSSRNCATMSTERGRLGRGPTTSSRMDTALSLGRGATKMGTSSRSGMDKGSSSPRSSATLGTGRGRGSASGKGATTSSGRSTTLGFGRGAAKMGTGLRSGTDKGPSSAETESKTLRS